MTNGVAVSSAVPMLRKTVGSYVVRILMSGRSFREGDYFNPGCVWVAGWYLPRLR
ncbi:hypothetical protein [Rhodococcus sp. NKCM2511]|uniref:hypothetical protein n=1 Tax=Rhodococcus sp. NKCM2511 TaxID=2766011 RepID=UPI001910058E|nr:hypothetical protein [Rhodococcus sp. NKCM2511]